jgi:hypothetical protein
MKLLKIKTRTKTATIEEAEEAYYNGDGIRDADGGFIYSLKEENPGDNCHQKQNCKTYTVTFGPEKPDFKSFKKGFKIIPKLKEQF